MALKQIFDIPDGKKLSFYAHHDEVLVMNQPFFNQGVSPLSTHESNKNGEHKIDVFGEDIPENEEQALERHAGSPEAAAVHDLYLFKIYDKLRQKFSAQTARYGIARNPPAGTKPARTYVAKHPQDEAPSE